MRHLYLLEADGSHLRRLTGDYEGITWNWSPDGRQLAFTCFEEDYRSPQRHGKLHIMDLARETVRQVTEDAAYPAWSRETNELAFLWSYDAHSLFRMDADGTNRQILFHSDLMVSPYGWSPDNKLLACYLWSRSHWGTEYQDSDIFHVVDAQGNLVFQEDWGASSPGLQIAVALPVLLRLTTTKMRKMKSKTLWNVTITFTCWHAMVQESNHRLRRRTR